MLYTEPCIKGRTALGIRAETLEIDCFFLRSWFCSFLDVQFEVR